MSVRDDLGSVDHCCTDLFEPLDFGGDDMTNGCIQQRPRLMVGVPDLGAARGPAFDEPVFLLIRERAMATLASLVEETAEEQHGFAGTVRSIRHPEARETRSG